MTLRVIQTSDAPKAVGAYSQAIRTGEWLFVSGQLGIDPATGKMIEDDFASQTRQAIHNLISIVKASGGKITDISAVDVFLMDMSRFKEFNAIYEECFEGHKPARAAIQVSGLPLGGLIELKCIACFK